MPTVEVCRLELVDDHRRNTFWWEARQETPDGWRVVVTSPAFPGLERRRRFLGLTLPWRSLDQAFAGYLRDYHATHEGVYDTLTAAGWEPTDTREGGLVVAMRRVTR